MGVNREDNLLLLALYHRRKKGTARYSKKYWVRDIFAVQKIKGEYYNLVREMRLSDQEFFHKMFRMSPPQLKTLTKLVAPYILQDDARRETIPPQERLCMTLRYLASGTSHVTLAGSYRISPTSMSRIIPKTCEALWQALQGIGFIKMPKNKEEWKRIALEFENKWNVPNCLGAMDGKHSNLLQIPDPCSLLI